ncbi:DUF3768 domain-containing protein [Methylobacterium indicum]|uniref:DUF3768 domain-containing protein n=1 Tax=Methylobacterium indicum TaxID=1775910 RepID=UPI001FCC6327|nr:DUF3768 domain-containing protein [Methylobacterium indicum]
MKHENTKVIKLNDAFRTSMVGGSYVLTSGIAALSPADLGAVMHKVRTFDAFTEDDDTEGEHECGSFEHNGVQIVWKIDYYDRQIEWHADPEDPETSRVLTIMLASEY